MMEKMSTTNLMNEFRHLVTDAEDLLKATAGQAGDKVAAARARAADTLRSAKEHLPDIDETLERTRAAARATDEYVHENAWAVAGIAVAVGLMLGYLLSRR
jgi:ElaB/YqjD/DUF883 family membrane-anchored ribosome-binding protein